MALSIPFLDIRTVKTFVMDSVFANRAGARRPASHQHGRSAARVEWLPD